MMNIRGMKGDWYWSILMVNGSNLEEWGYNNNGWNECE